MRLHQLQVAGRQTSARGAHPRHVGVVHRRGAVGVLAVRVPAHTASHRAGGREARHGTAEAGKPKRRVVRVEGARHRRTVGAQRQVLWVPGEDLHAAAQRRCCLAAG